MDDAAKLNALAIVGGTTSFETNYQAVARIGYCSGVLVSPTVVLTNGHCLDGPVDHIEIAGTDARVTSCTRHPQYEPGHRVHDIGACHLASPSTVTPMQIDAEAQLVVGTEVRLVGFGRSAAFANDSGALRVVESIVTRNDNDGVDVGTSQRTACPGDSGGPVLVHSEGHWRVVALLRGAAGAICASPSQTVGLHQEIDWLRSASGTDFAPSGRPYSGESVVLMVVSVCAVSVAIARSVSRANANRSPHRRAVGPKDNC